MPRKRDKLGIRQIVKLIDEHYALTGRWPTSRSGRLITRPDLTWEAINTALRRGCRGLPGGDSLARVLQRHRGITDTRLARPTLTRQQILEWADQYHLRHGEWPDRTSGRVAEAPELTWETINRYLRRGGPRLAGGSSLVKLLREARQVWDWRGTRPLTERLILKWADDHRNRTGRLPVRMAGPVLADPKDTWAAIDEALRHGRRGLSGGSSLYLLLCEHREDPIEFNRELKKRRERIGKAKPRYISRAGSNNSDGNNSRG